MLNSKNMKEMRKKLLTNMEQEVEAGHQLYICNFLLSWLLIVTGGQRPESLMKLKVQEVLEAEEAKDEDGEFTIQVTEHKTGTTYSIAHVPILNPVLLKLLHLYLIHVLHYEDMTEEEQKSTPVFQSKNNEPLQTLRPVVDWMKNEILVPEYNYKEAEHKNFTATIFRHGWATWGAHHPDQQVRDESSKAMNHSAAVSEKHYDAQRKKTALMFARAVTSHAGQIMKFEKTTK